MHVYSPVPRCCAFVVHKTFRFFRCLSVRGTPPTVCAMAGLHEIRELATPLISASQPAGGTHQQVMSPTLGYGTAGHGTSVTSATPQSSYARTEGGLGFAQDVAAGGASSGGTSLGLQTQRARSGCRPPVEVGKVRRASMRHSPAKRRAGAQAYRPSLACQVQVPSKGVGKAKHCQGE